MMVTYKNFEISEENGKLNFKNLKTGEEKKGVRIIHDRDFVFQVRKSQIKTKYPTATEFLTWLEKLVAEHNAIAYIPRICKMYVGECDYDFDMDYED